MQMLFVVVSVFFGLVVPGLAIAAFVKSSHTEGMLEKLQGQLDAYKLKLEQALADITALKNAAIAVERAPVAAVLQTKAAVRKAAARRANEESVASEETITREETVAREETVKNVAEKSTLVPPPLPVSAPPILPPPLMPQQRPPELPAAQPAPVEKPARDFEELIGARWAVWVGGLALAIGGLFLVRYSIEAGVFGPRVRLMMATVFAALLLGAGEALRRGVLMPPEIITRKMAQLPLSHAPLALTGAGVITAFGTVYAAFAVYGFLSHTTAFVLMGLVGVAAIAAALVHGQALAGLGLLASYATPVLVGGAGNSRWPLVVYLLVVTTAAAAVQNRLRSSWLAWGAVAGIAVWTALLSIHAHSPPVPELALTLGAMLIFAGSFIWFNKLDTTQAPDGMEMPLGNALPLVALTGLAAAIGWGFLTSHMQTGLYTAAALVGIIILLATALRDGRAAGLIITAVILPLGMILTWPSEAEDGMWLVRLLNGAIFAFAEPPLNSHLLARLTIASVCLLCAAPLLVLFGKISAKVTHSRQGLHALAFTGGLAPVVLTFAWAIRTGGLNRDLLIAAIFTAMMVVLALVSDQLYRRRGAEAASIGAAAYASGAALALGLAIAFALPGLWMAVGFAVAALGVSAVNQLRPLPALRRVAAMMATTAVLRGVSSPALFGDESWPIFNWYIAAYGIPALALAGAAYILRKQILDRTVRVVEGSALLALAAFVFFELRHAFNRWDMDARILDYLVPPGFHETWALTGAALGFVALGLWLNKRGGGSPAKAAYVGGAAVMLGAVVLGYGLLHNPFIPGNLVGGVVLFNHLTVGYALAALALGAGAWMLARDGVKRAAKPLGVAALVLVGFWAVTQIRMAFHGVDLFDNADLGLGEAGVYTLALIAAVLGLHFGTSRARSLRATNVAALGSAALLCVVITSPFDFLRLSGPAFLDSSFVGYLLTGAGFGLLAWLGRHNLATFGQSLTTANRVAAIGLIYLYLMVQVRRSFAGVERFAFALTTEGEQYTYSLVTLGYGVALLAVGFKLASRNTRLASALFVTLAVAKVFLWDMADLQGLWRAFSFIGLGAVLIGIGLVYQRVLFGKERAPQPPALPS